MGPLDAERIHEGGDIVGQKLGGIDAARFVGFTGAARIEGDAREVLGVFPDLKSVAGVVGGQVRDGDQGITGALLVIVDGQIVRFHLRHSPSLRGRPENVVGLQLQEIPSDNDTALKPASARRRSTSDR